ncbi:MAG: lysophospholipid acyltransferase family protein [bacterium]
MVYWVSYYFFRFLIKVFFRGKCYDQNNLPEKGPYIAILNHGSILDVLALAMVVRGRVSTMVKHTLFQVPILTWWLKAVNMFPVVRGTGDQKAFEYALDLLNKGYILYMAPEGTRKHDPDNPPRAHTGFIRLAHLANCPVVPIAVTGTREALPPGAKFPRFVKVKAKVGKQMQFEKVKLSVTNHEKLQQQADQAMSEVYRLKRELLALNNK